MLEIQDSRTGQNILEIRDSGNEQAEGELPKCKAKNPEPLLEEMSELLEDIKSGKFKVVDYKVRVQNEVLQLPNPGGKPFTKSTGKQVKSIEIKVSNQVID
ncbi:Uncharacterised protein [uncultured archaeon]|nr:Uncharacterised protein [uncultured archaeon]